MTNRKPAIHRQVPITIREDVPVVMTTFDHLSERGDHFAYLFNRAADPSVPPLVRVHSSCVTGDIFGSHRCDCGDQLTQSIARLDREGGVLVYLFQEGRGIGLKAKIDAYALQDRGLDTYAANTALGHQEDERHYKVAADMLTALRIGRIRLLTNNPDKIDQLRQAGIDVAAAEALPARVRPENRAYLEAKRKRGHTLDL